MDNQTVPLDSSSNSAKEPLYILSLLNNELMSSSWKLTNEEYSIGRSSKNKIILDERIYSQKFLLVYDSKVPAQMIKSIVSRFNKDKIEKKKIKQKKDEK